MEDSRIPFLRKIRPDLDTLGKKQYNTYGNLGIIGFEPKDDNYRKNIER